MTGHRRHRRHPHSPPVPGGSGGSDGSDGSGRRRRLAATVLTAWGVHPRTTAHDATVLAVTEPTAGTVRHAATHSGRFAPVPSVDAAHLDVGVHGSHRGLLGLPSPGGTGGPTVLADLARSLGGEPAVHPVTGTARTAPTARLAPTAPERESP